MTSHGGIECNEKSFLNFRSETKSKSFRVQRATHLRDAKDENRILHYYTYAIYTRSRGRRNEQNTINRFVIEQNACVFRFPQFQTLKVYNTIVTHPHGGC